MKRDLRTGDVEDLFLANPKYGKRIEICSAGPKGSGPIHEAKKQKGPSAEEPPEDQGNFIQGRGCFKEYRLHRTKKGYLEAL